jgi:hypothetical protein
MKKITLILLSVFITGFLMAQEPSGGSITAGNYSSQATILYAQMNPVDTIPVVASQQFTDFNSVAQTADDFIIPIGKTWSVTSVSTIGAYWNGSGPVDSFTVQFFADIDSLPAATPMFEQTGLTFTETSGGVFDIPLSSAIQLNAGHYWISIIAVMPYNPKGQWGSAWNNAPQANYVFADRDPDQLFGGVWPATWGHSSDVSIWPSRSNYDLCFQINGDEGTASVPVSNWAILFGVLLIGTFVVIRYKRSIA